MDEPTHQDEPTHHEPPAASPAADSAEISAKLDEFLFTATQFKMEEGRFSKVLRPLVKVWSRLTKRVGDAVFERGVDTAGHARDIPHYHPDRVWYQPSGWSYLRRALPPREVGEDDVFCDIGSGKGRVVLQAATKYPFKRVIGVEISEELTEVARANVESQRDSLRSEVELVTADAAEYAIPDDVTVLYLYYPFVGETFTRVLGNIEDSLQRRPRRLFLVYAMPVLESELLASGTFERVRRIRITGYGVPHRIGVYATKHSA